MYIFGKPDPASILLQKVGDQEFL